MGLTIPTTLAPQGVQIPRSVSELDELLRGQTDGPVRVDVGEGRPVTAGMLLDAEACALGGRLGESRVWLMIDGEAGRQPHEWPLWMIRRIETRGLILDLVPLAGEMSPFQPLPEVW